MNISFTSNIKFIPKSEFDNIYENKFSPSPSSQFIIYGERIKGRNIQICDNAGTHQVRDCSAGGFINEQGIGMFHFFPYESNIASADNVFAEELYSKIGNPKSGFLFGSKDYTDSYYNNKDELSFTAMSLFDKLKEILSKKVDISSFKTHLNLAAQTNALYIKSEDTIYMNTELIREDTSHLKDCILSPEDIENTFEKAYISPNDKLFINEIEVLPKEYPELFILA